LRVIDRRFSSRRIAVRYSLRAACTALAAPSFVTVARFFRASSICRFNCCIAGHSGL
jgi:hypothetical protein